MTKKLLPFLYGFIVSLVIQPAFAQNSISSTWSKPNLLGWDSSWRYKPGKAAPGYFAREFKDDEWNLVPYKFIDTIKPQTSAFKNIAVFRRKFFVPDSLKGKAVDLYFNLFGASEIYFDGKLVYSKGRIDEPIENFVVLQRTVPLFLDSLPWHVISIYYGSTISPHRNSHFYLYGLNMTMVATETKNGDQYDEYHHWLVSFGIIAAFALFFWFVFAFYPNRIASLCSALMLTNFSLTFFGPILRDIHEPALWKYVLGEKLWEIGFSSSFGWLLFFIYSVYYKRLQRYNFFVIGMILITDFLIITENGYWFNISLVFIGLYIVECWRMIIKGLIGHKTGFWIIAIGVLLSILGVVTVIFNLLHLFPDYLTPAQTVLGIAVDLCFPLSLALHLAWEFGTANRDLRKQVLQVKELSDKNLQQEQEKQQILSTQNEMLELQVTDRTAALNESLQQIKSTQAQLIQSEKMASLGQLTAGIAHEIQNPLNFVNNFSDVNKEMIVELRDEIDKGNYSEVKAIAKDIEANEEKINYHGKRADSIVKGMLQHSRVNAGVKELTDINALCDEYLRLSYHGFRAKDKNFNAAFKTEFDPAIGKIHVVSQDIGRVLLNIFNNAFYAVRQPGLQRVNQNEPTVTVQTKREGDKVLIRITDNGSGIPKNIIDKIFQPFFTTKPTGQGTGLGLSLSYDIITKEHNGSIHVESQESDGTTFTIQLPVH